MRIATNRSQGGSLDPDTGVRVVATLTQHPSKEPVMALAFESRMLIDGKLVEATGGRTYGNINPATEDTIASVAEGDAASVLPTELGLGVDVAEKILGNRSRAEMGRRRSGAARGNASSVSSSSRSGSPRSR